MMPFTLFLLEPFLNRFFFRLDSFVTGEESVDGRFQLLNIVESHDNAKNFMFEFSFNINSCQVENAR